MVYKEIKTGHYNNKISSSFVHKLRIMYDKKLPYVRGIFLYSNIFFFLFLIAVATFQYSVFAVNGGGIGFGWLVVCDTHRHILSTCHSYAYEVRRIDWNEDLAGQQRKLVVI